MSQRLGSRSLVGFGPVRRNEGSKKAPRRREVFPEGSVEIGKSFEFRLVQTLS